MCRLEKYEHATWPTHETNTWAVGALRVNILPLTIQGDRTKDDELRNGIFSTVAFIIGASTSIGSGEAAVAGKARGPPPPPPCYQLLLSITMKQLPLGSYHYPTKGGCKLGACGWNLHALKALKGMDII